MATQAPKTTKRTPAARASEGTGKLAKDPNARIIKSDAEPTLKDKVADVADAAKGQIAGAVDTAKDQFNGAVDTAKTGVQAGARKMGDVAEYGQHQAETLEAQVRRHPYIALSTAFGLGIALTLLLRSKD